jgi:hypothetical protein
MMHRQMSWREFGFQIVLALLAASLAQYGLNHSCGCTTQAHGPPV